MWLHRESLNKTQCKMERDQRWKLRQVTQEKQKLYLARQGRGLKSSVGTETYSGWMKDKKGLYNYISSESQGKYKLTAKLGG